MSDRLEVLYGEIAEHTQKLCKGGEGGCTVPHSCCDSMACEITITRAHHRDVVLKPTGHPDYPLMNPDGSCSAPPHLRPLCSMHCCCINSFGRHLTDKAWTARYWLLRNEIETLELERMTP